VYAGHSIRGRLLNEARGKKPLCGRRSVDEGGSAAREAHFEGGGKKTSR